MHLCICFLVMLIVNYCTCRIQRVIIQLKELTSDRINNILNNNNMYEVIFKFCL